MDEALARVRGVAVTVKHLDALLWQLLTWPVHATKSGLDTELSNVVETSIQTQLGSLRQI